MKVISRGVSTSISKEPYIRLLFSRGGGWVWGSDPLRTLLHTNSVILLKWDQERPGHGRIHKNPSGCVCMGGGGPDNVFFLVILFQRGPYEPPSWSNPIAFRGGSVPVFLRKLISACDFPGGGGPDPCPPLDPPMLGFVVCLKIALILTYVATQTRQN